MAKNSADVLVGNCGGATPIKEEVSAVSDDITVRVAFTKLVIIVMLLKAIINDRSHSINYVVENGV